MSFFGIAFGSSSGTTSENNFRGVISMCSVYDGSLPFFLGASGHVRIMGSRGGDSSSSDDMFVCVRCCWIMVLNALLPTLQALALCVPIPK